MDTEYETKQVSILNIVLLGKTEVGKTTFLNMLQNPHQITQRKTFSQTRNPELVSVAVVTKSQVYVLRVVDTPGIFENKERASEIRTNAQLLNLVYDCGFSFNSN